MFNRVQDTACMVQVPIHDAAWQNATQRGFAMWQKLVGICRKTQHIRIKK